MSINEIINELDVLRLVLERKRDRERTGTGVWQTSNDRVIAINEAIAKLREYQAIRSGDTSARLAAIKDMPTERVIALAQAEAAGLVSISSAAAGAAHQDAQPNEPLTLEELEKMDGQPVWVESPNVDRKHSGRWGIVDCVIVPNKTLFLKGDYPCHDYGTVWLAYRRPPTAQPSTTEEPYGCGVPLAGKEA